MKFFLEKQLIKFSCSYQPVSFCKIKKKLLELISVMRMRHSQPQNGSFILNKIFLVQTIIITFIYLLVLFIVQNLKKFLQRIQSYEDVPFLVPKWSICPNFFLEKKLISFSSTYWPLSLCKTLKIFYTGSRVMRMYHFGTQNGPLARMRIFSENMLIGLVPFIHAYLNAKNQSQILIY